MLLIPLLIISLSMLSSAYILSYKVDQFRYALSRYEQFLHNRYYEKSCKNLDDLYRSYDPRYLRNC